MFKYTGSKIYTYFHYNIVHTSHIHILHINSSTQAYSIHKSTHRRKIVQLLDNIFIVICCYCNMWSPFLGCWYSIGSSEQLFSYLLLNHFCCKRLRAQGGRNGLSPALALPLPSVIIHCRKRRYTQFNLTIFLYHVVYIV